MAMAMCLAMAMARAVAVALALALAAALGRSLPRLPRQSSPRLRQSGEACARNHDSKFEI